MCIGFLIVAEAKLKESDLMVFVSDLEECEFGKTRILFYQVSRKWNMTEWFRIERMR